MMPDVIDSALTAEEALRQNPRSPAPSEIVTDLEVLSVTYVGFDGLIHQGQIVVHFGVVEDIRFFFSEALKFQFPIAKVIPISDPSYSFDDVLSCTDNNSSAFNYRLIQGSDQLSIHSHGRAFDINPVQNIYIRFDDDGKEIYRLPENGTYNTDAPGTLSHTHLLVRLMKDRGWTWGGEWTPDSGRVDYQHFEKRL